MQWFPKIDGDQ